MILLQGGKAGTRRLGLLGVLAVALVVLVVLSGLAVLAMAGLALALIGAAVLFVRRLLGAGRAGPSKHRDAGSLEIEPDFEVLPPRHPEDAIDAQAARLRARDSSGR